MPEPTVLDALKHGPAETNVESLLLRRWSPRAFAQRLVSEADLSTIFNAGLWAASSYNEQPWRFIVGRKGTPTWDKIWRVLVPGNQVWANSAPVLYATFAKQTLTQTGESNPVAAHDVGAASANLALQATALGLHAHGMAGFDREALRSAFKVPDDFESVACWALGYLGDPAALPERYKDAEYAPRKRKALGEVVFAEWEQPALP